MNSKRSLLAIAVLALYASPLAAQKPASPPPAPLKWGPAPAPFPSGAKMAVVSGDPSKTGIFTVQLSFPDGYLIPPHVHPTDESVTVISGSFSFGMGDVVRDALYEEMKPGTRRTIPATAVHFAKAKGATVVELSAVGPFKMTMVRPGSVKVRK